ncbi:hypothetical protein [Peribacillus sp. NJ11]|uniref:hypothetical protein n=1 Tax=Peribacillus sp. NJ11 TaxID=3055861 RepID=UPI00338D6CCD
MSFPNIPNITPTISVTVEQTIPLLLSSIALEELALAHIINAEAEKIQFVLGTLEGGRTLSPPEVTISNLLAIDSSVQRTLRDVIKKEMLLEFKFENVLDLIASVPPPPPPTVTITLEADSTLICDADSGVGPPSPTLTGQVLVNGSPPPANTPVLLTVDNPALGTIFFTNPAPTDASGNFFAFFDATDGPGTVTITASALGTNSNTVDITIVDCSTISAFSFGPPVSTVCPTGSGANIAILSGQVLVDGGVPIAGIVVGFSVDNPLLGSVVAGAVTDASGNFTTTAAAIDGPGTFMVTASLLGVGVPPISVIVNIVDCDS